jgi:hypothetical protein
VLSELENTAEIAGLASVRGTVHQPGDLASDIQARLAAAAAVVDCYVTWASDSWGVSPSGGRFPNSVPTSLSHQQQSSLRRPSLVPPPPTLCRPGGSSGPPRTSTTPVIGGNNRHQQHVPASVAGAGMILMQHQHAAGHPPALMQAPAPPLHHGSRRGSNTEVPTGPVGPPPPRFNAARLAPLNVSLYP